MTMRKKACMGVLWMACAAMTAPVRVTAQSAKATARRVDVAKSQQTLTAQAAPLPSAAPATTADAAATQQRLLEILHVSPMLAGVLANDPSLLANADYVAKTDPELAVFLAQHAEVARNPAFYLFSDLRKPGSNRYEPLEEHEGIVQRSSRQSFNFDRFFNEDILPVLVIGLVATAVLLLSRLILNNRRWSRSFKLQSEVHAQLIARFGTSEELMAYMQTEAGRRFLEAAPIAVEDKGGRLPNVASRVLLNAQIGVVMVLLGLGLLMVRSYVPGGHAAMLVLGVLVLMPGLGFMLSAAMALLLARRLGLMMPGAPVEAGDDAAGLR